MKLSCVVLVLLILVPFVFASDSEFITINTGDDEFYIVTYGDEEFNTILTSQNTSTIQPTTTQSTTSGSSSNNKEIRYDVSVNTAKGKYFAGESVQATIALINTGNSKDEDAVISYYLLSPEGNILDKSQENILDIPPVNSGDTYCKRHGGITIDGKCKKIIIKTLFLPSNSSVGEWSFNIDYKSPEQELIHSFDSFEVIVLSSNIDVSRDLKNKKTDSTSIIDISTSDANSLSDSTKNNTPEKNVSYQEHTMQNTQINIFKDFSWIPLFVFGAIIFFSAIFYITRKSK